MGKKIMRRGASIIGAVAVVAGGVVVSGVVGAGTANAVCIEDGHGGCYLNQQPLFPGSAGEFLADAHLAVIDALLTVGPVLVSFS
ncbi:hypothetical protein ACWDUM_10450 [Rhodococcus sp. NPDC003322]